jgi:hypothetical protein
MSLPRRQILSFERTLGVERSLGVRLSTRPCEDPRRARELAPIRSGILQARCRLSADGKLMPTELTEHATICSSTNRQPHHVQNQADCAKPDGRLYIAALLA